MENCAEKYGWQRFRERSYAIFFMASKGEMLTRNYKVAEKS